jgi:hypothetical protein
MGNNLTLDLAVLAIDKEIAPLRQYWRLLRGIDPPHEIDEREESDSAKRRNRVGQIPKFRTACKYAFIPSGG